MSEPQHRKSAEPERQLTARELNRASRDAHRVAARRRIILATVVAVSLVVGSVVWTYLNIAPEEPPTVEAIVAPDVGASALIVIEDEGRLATILLVAASAEQPSRIVAIPQSLLAVVPGFGEQSLGEAYQIGGIDLVSLTIINLLGARIDDRFLFEADTLAGVFEGPLEVDLDRPLVVQQGEEQRVVAGEGLQPRPPETLIRLLTEKGTDNDVDFLFRQGEVWEAIFAQVAARQGVADAILVGATPAGSAAITGAAQDPDIVIGSLPAVRVNTLASGEERYSFDVADGAAFVEQAMPYLAIGEQPRLVVEILNGNGGVGVTQPVARTLVLAGYRVLKTDNAGTQDYPTTQIIAQGRERRQAALETQAVLGYGEVVLEVRQPSGVVDLTIILGQDTP